MAEQGQTQPAPSQPKQERKSGKSGNKRGPGLAPIQGEYSDDRPEHRIPGTRSHLGDDPVYGGEPTPMGQESEEDARNR